MRPKNRFTCQTKFSSFSFLLICGRNNTMFADIVSRNIPLCDFISFGVCVRHVYVIIMQNDPEIASGNDGKRSHQIYVCKY